MVASTDIKFYVHTNNNAPQLQNAYGSMINVLDACLIDGIQIGVVSSLTASGNTVTATFGAAHNLMQYQVIKITGANQPEFNGEHRILSIPDTSSFTFELAAAPSVSTATGTISASLPPLGWEKPFSSSNPNGGGKAAYRSLNPLLPSRPFLRVVDELDPAYTATYAKFAKVGIVEDMSDIDTMIGVQAPFDPANPDKNWVATGSGTTVINGWARWYYACSNEFSASTSNDTQSLATGNRFYVVVGNSEYFYVFPASTPSSIYALPYGFGAFHSVLDADGSATFLNSTLNNNAANNILNKQGYTGLVGTHTNQKTSLHRSFNQNAASVLATALSLGVAANVYSGASDYIGSSTLNNESYFAPIFLNESILRGRVKGLYWLFQNKPNNHMEAFMRNGEIYLAVMIGASSGGFAGQGQIICRIG
ncbi:hypothetical protein [Acinetobacter towneri]|uniref:hypothetical protein n=1 Tax=Acinetobacter towneri TaxID=202956 RepID=UPI0034D5A747